MRTDTNKSSPVADQLLTEAFHRVGRREGVHVQNVDIDIDAVELSRESLLEDLAAGNELSSDELKILLESENVDTREVQEHIRKQVFDE